jgi:hypothetical protein
MLTLGLCASWLGTLLWNRASSLLPTPLVGQLIVFETLAAFAYAFIWRGCAARRHGAARHRPAGRRGHPRRARVPGRLIAGRPDGRICAAGR